MSSLGPSPGLSGSWRLELALLRVLPSLARVTGALLPMLHRRARSELVTTALCLRLLCFSVGNWSLELPALFPFRFLWNQLKTFW